MLKALLRGDEISETAIVTARDEPLLPGRGAWWDVRASTGPAADLHHREIPEQAKRLVWTHRVQRPALVLGSTQPITEARDAGDLSSAGIELLRRRSGGGAVLMQPYDTWIDVLIGQEDPLWENDVGRAFAWLGGVWQRALARLGVNRTSVHVGPMKNKEWGRHICFAGLGPGEVSGPDGHKIVGMSQRRTRSVARFQTAVPYATDLTATASFLSPTAVPSDLTVAAIPIGIAIDSAVLTVAFLEELHRLP